MAWKRFFASSWLVGCLSGCHCIASFLLRGEKGWGGGESGGRRGEEKGCYSLLILQVLRLVGCTPGMLLEMQMIRYQ